MNRYHAMVFALALAAGLAKAAPSASSVSRDEKEKFCAVLDQMAREVMAGRQEGVPMPKAMEIMAGSGTEYEKQLGRDLVMSAYEKRRWQTKGQQKVEIDNFADYWSKICYKQAYK